jgi:hypothetical protein
MRVWNRKRAHTGLPDAIRREEARLFQDYDGLMDARAREYK